MTGVGMCFGQERSIGPLAGESWAEEVKQAPVAPPRRPMHARPAPSGRGLQPLPPSLAQHQHWPGSRQPWHQAVQLRWPTLRRRLLRCLCHLPLLRGRQQWLTAAHPRPVACCSRIWGLHQPSTLQVSQRLAACRQRPQPLHPATARLQRQGWRAWSAAPPAAALAWGAQCTAPRLPCWACMLTWCPRQVQSTRGRKRWSAQVAACSTGHGRLAASRRRISPPPAPAPAVEGAAPAAGLPGLHRRQSRRWERQTTSRAAGVLVSAASCAQPSRPQAAAPVEAGAERHRHPACQPQLQPAHSRRLAAAAQLLHCHSQLQVVAWEEHAMLTCPAACATGDGSRAAKMAARMAARAHLGSLSASLAQHTLASRRGSP